MRQKALWIIGVLIFALAGYLLWTNRPGSDPETRTRADYEQRAVNFFEQQPEAPILDENGRSAFEAIGVSVSPARSDSGGEAPSSEDIDRAVARATDEELVVALASAPDLSPPDLRRDAPAAVPNVSSEKRRELARLVAEWLTVRATGDPIAYAAWMRSRGRQLRPLEEIESDSNPALKSAYDWAAEQIPGGNSDRLRLFREIYRLQFERTNGALRPVAIAGGDNGGVEMRFGRCATERISHGLISGADTRWLAGTARGGLRHWDPPATYEEVLQRDGEALCAVVFVGMQGATGKWIPLRLYAYFDPEGGGWRIHNVAIGNTSDLGWRVEF